MAHDQHRDAQQRSKENWERGKGARKIGNPSYTPIYKNGRKYYAVRSQNKVTYQKRSYPTNNIIGYVAKPAVPNIKPYVARPAGVPANYAGQTRLFLYGR